MHKLLFYTFYEKSFKSLRIHCYDKNYKFVILTVLVVKFCYIHFNATNQ